jgi:DNA polymerase elongation subunit (family B)
MNSLFNLYQDGLIQIQVSTAIINQQKILINEKLRIEKLLSIDSNDEEYHEEYIKNEEKLNSLKIFAINHIEKMQKKVLKSNIAIEDIMTATNECQGPSFRDVFNSINILDKQISNF